MPGKRKRRRVRGSDGKLYDPRKQSDNGKQAHESRVETAARRTKWKLGGLTRALGALVAAVTVRPLRAVGGMLRSTCARLTGRSSDADGKRYRRD